MHRRSPRASATGSSAAALLLVTQSDERASVGACLTTEGDEMSTPYAFVARIEAKPDKAEEVAALLIGALPLAVAEPGTVGWYAARTSPTTFWIFDTFGSEDARQAHINGKIAAALMAKADELLASPPEILAADILASK
jgi:quinol monooxygenase YgiN